MTLCLQEMIVFGRLLSRLFSGGGPDGHFQKMPYCGVWLEFPPCTHVRDIDIHETGRLYNLSSCPFRACLMLWPAWYILTILRLIWSNEVPDYTGIQGKSLGTFGQHTRPYWYHLSHTIEVQHITVKPKDRTTHRRSGPVLVWYDLSSSSLSEPGKHNRRAPDHVLP